MQYSRCHTNYAAQPSQHCLVPLSDKGQCVPKTHVSKLGIDHM